MQRFDHDCTSVNEAEQYMRNRAIQLLQDDFKLTNIKPAFLESETVKGVEATFEKNGKNFYSLYILKNYRAQGVYAKYKASPIVTVPNCNIENFLKHKNIPYELAGSFLSNQAYKTIEAFYGNTKAKRSGCYYMEHIDEGLCILNKIKATEKAKEGYCLHPLFQDDWSFRSCWRGICTDDTVDIPPAMLLAVEYRNVANAYLSPMGRRKAEEIKLSPIEEVNDMLIADKVQNRKAFEACPDMYPNKIELDYYFKVWLERLGISESHYQKLKNDITVAKFQFL